MLYVPAMQLTLEVPDDVMRALPVPPEERRQRLQTELACLLYAKGWLSFGQGAQLAALSHDRFGWELGDRGIPRHYTEADLEHDLAYARDQRHVSDL